MEKREIEEKGAISKVDKDDLSLKQDYIYIFNTH